MTGSIRPIEEIRLEKIRKIEELKKLGVNPYPAFIEFESISIEGARKAATGEKVAVSGRVKSIRSHGKLIFFDISDGFSNIQVAVKSEDVTEKLFKISSYIDAGDFVEVTGELFNTKTGELTINTKKLNILSKAIRPLPEEKTLSDKETRLRKRYLDLLVNKSTRDIFNTRHKITRGVRDFLNNQNIVEVETPVLQPLYGGANAKPFTTDFNALNTTAYLRIAPELYLKRLVVGGMNGVYEIAKNFRNEGIDQTHYPEFSMLEVYVSYYDYQNMMTLMEDMLKYISHEALGLESIQVGDNQVNLDNEWPRIAMTDLIRDHLDFDIENATEEDIKQFVKENLKDVAPQISTGELIFRIFDDLITHKLLNPTWVIDYPKEVSPLSKEHRTKAGFVERFELYIGGKEVMDGWSEVNDAIEQRKRFEAESYRDLDETEEAQPLDEDFLESMEYGMPPVAGVGVGIDRLTMFFTNVWAIQEVILFPFKKDTNNDQTKEVSQVLVDSNLDSMLPTREQTQNLVKEYIKNEALLRHVEMVAVAMEEYAKKLGEDSELWYQTGLLHDLDWEMYPDEHPNKAINEILNEKYPSNLLTAVAAHAPDRTGVEPTATLDKYLYACDEISGFMNALSLMRPNGFSDMQPKSVKKKLKDKGFAANIKREDITKGVELIGTELDEHLQFLIDVFRDFSPILSSSPE